MITSPDAPRCCAAPQHLQRPRGVGPSATGPLPAGERPTHPTPQERTCSTSAGRTWSSQSCAARTGCEAGASPQEWAARVRSSGEATAPSRSSSRRLWSSRQAALCEVARTQGASSAGLRRRSATDQSEVILTRMTHRVGPKGQVVIPKGLRDELGIEPGDEVSFWRHDDHVAVRPASHRRPLRGRFEGSPLVDALTAERNADRHRDSAR